MIRALIVAVVVGLAGVGRSETIPCFGKDRGNPGCSLNRLDDVEIFKGTAPHPWWKCCEKERDAMGILSCRSGFEMYLDLKDCAVACGATKKELAESEACYTRYMNKRLGRRRAPKSCVHQLDKCGACGDQPCKEAR